MGDLVIPYPGRVDFVSRGREDRVLPPIRRGSNLDRTLYLELDDGEAVDLSGWQARTSVREAYDDETPALNLTTENGGHELGEDGSVRYLATAVQMEALDAGTSTQFPRSKRYIYDTELIDPDGIVMPFAEGYFEVVEDVTKES